MALGPTVTLWQCSVRPNPTGHARCSPSNWPFKSSGCKANPPLWGTGPLTLCTSAISGGACKRQYLKSVTDHHHN